MDCICFAVELYWAFKMAQESADRALSVCTVIFFVLLGYSQRLYALLLERLVRQLPLEWAALVSNSQCMCVCVNECKYLIMISAGGGL